MYGYDLYRDIIGPEEELDFDSPERFVNVGELWCDRCNGTGLVGRDECPICCGDSVDEE